MHRDLNIQRLNIANWWLRIDSASVVGARGLFVAHFHLSLESSDEEPKI